MCLVEYSFICIVNCNPIELIFYWIIFAIIFLKGETNMKRLIKVTVAVSMVMVSLSVMAKPQTPFVGTKYFQMHKYPQCDDSTCVSYDSITISKTGKTVIKEHWVSGETSKVYVGPYSDSMYSKNYGESFTVDGDNIYLLDDDGEEASDCYQYSDNPSTKTYCAWELGDS